MSKDIKEYKYILMTENDFYYFPDGEVKHFLAKGDIIKIKNVLQLNPHNARLFITLENGLTKWNWEPESDVNRDFIMLTEVDLRKYKLNKLKEKL